ncbi:hypothetical protein FUT13_25500 [Bacillus toyonensis]|nr:hypothetical protein F8507_18420 [Bacillus toyonensis]MBE7140244.1 hypothetical protein [Bacillus toyonensis]
MFTNLYGFLFLLYWYEYIKCTYYCSYFICKSRIKWTFYPAICRAVRPPPQNSAEAKKLGGGRAARKSPIGEG